MTDENNHGKSGSRRVSGLQGGILPNGSRSEIVDIEMKLKSLSELRRLLPGSPPSLPDSPSPLPGSPSPLPGSPPLLSGSDKSMHDGKGRTVRIFLDTKGRKGKSVTIVSGLQHNPATMKEIAKLLKERCATGGTVKNGNIELQGDRRAPATEELQRMNYVVRS